MRRSLVFAVVAAAFVAGCSDDDTKALPDASAPPITVCEAASGDVPTVTIDVDDDSDGFGRFGLRTPTGLAAGSVQLVVAAAVENPDPIDVSVTSAGQTVFQFSQVAPGVQCGATVDLAPGDYIVTYGDSTKTFTVIA